MKYKLFWLLSAIYVVTIIFELYLNLFVPFDDRSAKGTITQIPLALIPIIGACIGLSVSRKWGAWKSRLGRAIILYSLGLMAWGGGVVGWLIYIYVIKQTEVPYPSPADFVYMLAQILWYSASITMARVIGAQYGFKRNGWIKAIAGTVAAVTLSYVLLVVVARDGQFTVEGFSLKTFFDFYYPIATALSLTLISVIYFLAHKYLGGLYKKSLVVLFLGFIFQFFGDFYYTYATSRDTYFNGHWSDMLFMTAMLILSLGLILYDPERKTTANINKTNETEVS